MDERVFSITKIGPAKPSKRFDNCDMRLITLKDLDTGKSKKCWLDSRWKSSWNRVNPWHEGDLITNVVDLEGYDAVSIDNARVIKCIHDKQTSLVDAEQPHEPLVVSDETYCNECNLISRRLNKHLQEVHKVNLFS